MVDSERSHNPWVKIQGQGQMNVFVTESEIEESARRREASGTPQIAEDQLGIGERAFSIRSIQACSTEGKRELEMEDIGGDDLFAILESLDSVKDLPSCDDGNVVRSNEKEGNMVAASRSVSQNSSNSSNIPRQDYTEADYQLEASPKSKRKKLAEIPAEEANMDGQQRMSHITVEGNRRKQMNEQLSVLRTLMPCFYVKRGDQASIIGGVIDYINELQQILQSLEAKKQRKVYGKVLSPRIVSSPRKPPLSPRLNLPISPRTPQPSSPYRPRLQQAGYLSPAAVSSLEASPTSSITYSSTINGGNELVANSKSAMGDVVVKFSGAIVESDR